METVQAQKVNTSYDPKMYALLAWLIMPLSSIYFIVDSKFKKDDFLQFHAYQSAAAGVALILINVVFGATIILLALLPIVNLVGLIVWIMGMVKAYGGEKYKFPIIGDWAEQQMAKVKGNPVNTKA